MHHIVQALEESISSKNWLASLFIALSIPDICGYLETPSTPSQARYERWFQRYVLPKYTAQIGPMQLTHVFLSASDCYALRCALLHEGQEGIVSQRAREALDRFHFIEPPSDGHVHCNQFNDVLQLQCDTFCNDILDGLRAWSRDTDTSKDVHDRMSTMLRVYPTLGKSGISI